MIEILNDTESDSKLWRQVGNFMYLCRIFWSQPVIKILYFHSIKYSHRQLFFLLTWKKKDSRTVSLISGFFLLNSFLCMIYAMAKSKKGHWTDRASKRSSQQHQWITKNKTKNLESRQYLRSITKKSDNE